MTKEESIIWFEDPRKYEYLRVSKIIRFSRKYPSTIRGIKNFYKIVGFMWPPEKVNNTYIFTVYWLKTYDRGAPEEDKGYGRDPPEVRPSESVLVEEILKMNVNHVHLYRGGRIE